MSNYINEAYFVDASTKSHSRYSVCEENKQNQWINSVAKQAAKLRADQIKETKICAKKVK